jgi:hypothetical protein
MKISVGQKPRRLNWGGRKVLLAELEWPEVTPYVYGGVPIDPKLVGFNQIEAMLFPGHVEMAPTSPVTFTYQPAWRRDAEGNGYLQFYTNPPQHDHPAPHSHYHTVAQQVAAGPTDFPVYIDNTTGQLKYIAPAGAAVQATSNVYMGSTMTENVTVEEAGAGLDLSTLGPLSVVVIGW